ncbi:MAG: glycosyltransferase family 2 protein [Gammaproteobacteria bacterium]|nr:glycosyltransferase family 2 protein [Gammaproteobacteria bacterium]
MLHNGRVAVLIPCYNEALTIAKVVESFRVVLPESKIYVYDNGSEDHTVTEAEKAGAIVHHESRQGKGNVVRRMFSDVEADIYVLIDGDNTYDVNMAPTMISRLIDEHLDMVIGIRCDADVEEGKKKVYRLGHRFGNKLFVKLIRMLFGMVQIRLTPHCDTYDV